MPVTTPLENVWAAADISGLSDNVTTLIIGFITIGLLFTARKYLARTGIR